MPIQEPDYEMIEAGIYGNIDDLDVFRINDRIYLNSVITDRTYAKIVQQTEQMKEEGFKSFSLIINSDGGEVAQTLAIIDHLSYSVFPNMNGKSIISGVACSGALLIHSVFEERLCTPNAMMMAHYSYHSSASGNIKQIQNSLQVLKHLDDFQMEVYSKFFTGAKKKLMEMLNTERYFFAYDALEYGFVHQIIGG